jgi:hypothetical protein
MLHTSGHSRRIHRRFITHCYRRGCPAAGLSHSIASPNPRPPGSSLAILAPLLYANSVQIGLIEPYSPGLAQRETELFLKHGLED